MLFEKMLFGVQEKKNKKEYKGAGENFFF